MAADDAKSVVMSTASPHSQAFRKLLEKMPVSTLLRSDINVVTVNADTPVVAAFQTLVQHKILSAPVWDEKVQKFTGFIDVRDLVQFVVAKAEEDEKHRALRAEQKRQAALASAAAPAAASDAHAAPSAHSHHSGSGSHSHHSSVSSSTDSEHLSIPPADFRAIFDVAAKFHQATDAQEMNVRYFAKQNKLYKVNSDDTLLLVAELLARGDVHRVPVMNNDETKVIDIISQSTFVKALHEHRNELKEILAKTIDEVKLGTRPVISVKSTESALETFRTMAKFHITGIAVVDENGRFCSNTSASDLKLFIQNPEKNIHSLRHPIIEFLNAIRRHDNPLVTRSPTISVRPSDTIEKAVGKLHVTHIHRIFVAEEAHGFKPEAVISLTDLLRYVLDVNDPSTAGDSNSPKITIDPV